MRSHGDQELHYGPLARTMTISLLPHIFHRPIKMVVTAKCTPEIDAVSCATVEAARQCVAGKKLSDVLQLADEKTLREVVVR